MSVTTIRRLGVAAFSAAIAALAVFGSPLRLRLYKADPSYYLSYVLDYADVADRFGQTYHGNRISYILVDRVAFALLGPEAGYLAVRWLLLAVAVATVVAIATPRTGTLPALALAAAVGLTPWLPRQLLWTHYDGFATVYLLVAAGLLLGPRRPWRAISAGALLGLVVNANLGYAVVVGSGVAAWWLAVPASRRERSRGLLALGAGLISAELVLSLTVRLLVGSGPWVAEWVAIRTALFLAGDDTWFTPLAEAIRLNPVLVVLPLLAVLALVASRREGAADRTDAARFGGAWLAGSATLILGLHLLARSAWLGTPFYVVTLLPAAVVAAIGVGERAIGKTVAAGAVPPGPAARASRWRVGPVLLLGWVVVLGLLWVDGRLRPEVLAVVAVAIVLSVVVTGAIASTSVGRRPTVTLLAPLLMPLLLLVTWAAPAQVPGPDGFRDLAGREAKEWTLFHGIVGVKEVVAESVPTGRALTFWHRVDGPEGEWLRQINMAYYGGGTSRLHADRGPDPYGMPELRPEQLTLLSQRRPISVVLIGLDRAELTAGLVALATALPDATTVAQRIIAGDTFDLHVAVVAIG